MKNTILITGGTGKFGLVLVRHFINLGWLVVTTSRDNGRLNQLKDSVGAHDSDFVCVEIDLQEEGAPKRLVEKLAGEGVQVTHLVNNARSVKTLAVSSDSTTHRFNFLGEFEMDVVIPYELSLNLALSDKHRLCNVVNVGSMYGNVAPNPFLYGGSLDQSPIQYGVSKAGLNHLTKELAVRLAPRDIRVNCVAYGGVEGRVDEAFLSRYASLVPSRRMLNEDEIIGPVDFLLSDSSSAVNGHVLVADGGWTIW